MEKTTTKSKYLFGCITLFLLLAHFCFSQTKTIEIYNYNQHGIREITPTKIIEIEREQIKIFEVDKNGIRSINPTQIIRDNNVYNVQNGIQEFLPIQRIETGVILPPIKLDSPLIFDIPFNFDF